MVDGKRRESLFSRRNKQLQLAPFASERKGQRRGSFPVKLVMRSLQWVNLAISFILRKSLLKILLNKGLVLVANAP